MKLSYIGVPPDILRAFHISALKNPSKGRERFVDAIGSISYPDWKDFPTSKISLRRHLKLVTECGMMLGLAKLICGNILYTDLVEPVLT